MASAAEVLLVSLLAASVLTACEGGAVLRSSSDSLGRLALLSDAKPGAGLDFGPIDCGADCEHGQRQPRPLAVMVCKRGSQSGGAN